MKTMLSQLNTLAIWLQDDHIGTIHRLAGDRYIFAFEEAYLAESQRPILSLSFKGSATDVIPGTRVYRLRLPPFFSNLLPEGHLRNYLASKVGVRPEREFFLLAELGADLPGAITASIITTDRQLMPPSFLLANRYKNHVMRFSLAGLQLKFSAMLAATGGLTVPADGIGGSWIIKLPSHRFQHVPENEFVMLALASRIDIDLPKNRLIKVEDINGLPDEALQLGGIALAVERFDRTAEGKRIHMEDFAQIFALYPDDKYKHKSYADIATVLWHEIGETAVSEFIRRVIFSIMIGNADMHLKNWSVIYPNGRTPALSPAYDILSTVPYLADDTLALSFGGSRRLDSMTQDQLRRFAEKACIPRQLLLTVTRETVEQTHAAWQTLSEKDLLPKKMQQQITQQIVKIAKNVQM